MLHLIMNILIAMQHLILMHMTVGGSSESGEAVIGRDAGMGCAEGVEFAASTITVRVEVRPFWSVAT